MMPIEASSEQVEQGLRDYVARIAAGFAVGTGATYCETAEFATAYIALPERAAGVPDHDAALVWDQQHGWALAIEPAPGGDLAVLAYQAETLVPVPAAVIAFARRVLAHGVDRPGAAPALDTDELDARLAAYAEPSLLLAPTPTFASVDARPADSTGQPSRTASSTGLVARAPAS